MGSSDPGPRTRGQGGLGQVMLVFPPALGEEEQQMEGFDAGADANTPRPTR